jgi:N-6 DNA Methylase
MNVTVESEPARRACISRVDQTSPGFAAPLAPKWHIAAPACGASLEAIIAQRGKTVRDVVSVLTRSWNASFDGRLFRADFSPRWSRDDAVESGERLILRTAWNIVAVWLAARAALSCGRLSLADSEHWFHSKSADLPGWCALFSNEAVSRAEQLLNASAYDDEFWALLPYILEEHGQGSRSSVMRDPGTAGARAAKRREGVFYTPADVAEYMVREALGSLALDASQARCLDPACGTGVFLLALIHEVRATAGSGFDAFEYAVQRLHGMDVSGHALDACAFVLLRECWPDAQRHGLSPWATWHRLRLNLVQADALAVGPGNCQPAITMNYEHVVAALERRERIQPCIGPASGKPDAFGLFRGTLPVNGVFPRIPGPFDCIVGNPPYAAIGHRPDFDRLSCEFRSLPESGAGAGANLFPLFIEMMWRLAHPERSAAALVTPLSIAYHAGTQFENCRRAMSAAGGRWRFAFFDREPHGLFGEEVKTRNAILFHTRAPEFLRSATTAEIETGPLRKWTSRTRRHLFDSIQFTRLGQSPVTFGIPKLDGESQAAAFRVLQKRTDRLPSLCGRMIKVAPVETLDEPPMPRVFIGGTAYNFLNVYRCAKLAEEERVAPMSESPVHCLEFRAEMEAAAAFAILSSRLTFWLWNVLGDGFHVSCRLYETVPFSRASFSPPAFSQLATLGEQLWLRLQEHRFTSLNGGRLTVGYRPLACTAELDAIDAMLRDAASLAAGFVRELREFVRTNAVVDHSDESRAHLRRHFKNHENE